MGNATSKKTANAAVFPASSSRINLKVASDQVVSGLSCTQSKLNHTVYPQSPDTCNNNDNNTNSNSKSGANENLSQLETFSKTEQIKNEDYRMMADLPILGQDNRTNSSDSLLSEIIPLEEDSITSLCNDVGGSESGNIMAWEDQNSNVKGMKAKINAVPIHESETEENKEENIRATSSSGVLRVCFISHIFWTLT